MRELNRIRPAFQAVLSQAYGGRWYSGRDAVDVLQTYARNADRRPGQANPGAN